jgi:phosphoheptose isomerase
VLAQAAVGVDRKQLTKAGEVLVAALERDATIYTCGNGGSAAIANHLVCDHQKGIQNNTHYRPKVVSLSSNIELITAIGNDISFSDIFLYPLRTAARKGDLLITISSSGDSENIVRAITWANQNGIDTIAFTGFFGGRSSLIADVNLHVPAHNYGVVEDIHQSFMHILAQYARQAAMSAEMIKAETF